MGYFPQVFIEIHCSYHPFLGENPLHINFFRFPCQEGWLVVLFLASFLLLYGKCTHRIARISVLFLMKYAIPFICH